ncbi:hypothetical protein [Oceanobacillus sp. FSL H7-0719]|uniref:hypothetical protein n=1 Tax=Oceanobacillus sp. FSL H7-0719 TaxID=2954507 RepID=UPI00324BFE8E
MFTNEVKVKGNTLKGQIIGNWSKDSYFAFKLSEIDRLANTFGEKDLDMLIDELTKIRDKVAEMNNKSSWMNG